MERINLKKYGFVRCEEEDFHDDGSNFKGYKLDELSFSYLKWDGNIYFSGRADYALTGIEKLNYNEYSKLPHYRYLDDLNGVAVSSLTDNDFIDLVNNARLFIQEYKEAVNNLSKLTRQDLLEKATQVINHYLDEYNEAETLLKSISLATIFALPKYEYNRIREEMLSLIVKSKLNVDELIDKYFTSQANGRNFIDSYADSLMQDSYAIRTIREIIAKL